MKQHLILIIAAGVIFLSYCTYKIGHTVAKYEMGTAQLQKRYVKMHGVDTVKLEYIFGEQEQGYYEHKCDDATHATCDNDCICDGLDCK